MLNLFYLESGEIKITVQYTVVKSNVLAQRVLSKYFTQFICEIVFDKVKGNEFQNLFNDLPEDESLTNNFVGNMAVSNSVTVRRVSIELISISTAFFPISNAG